jgi:acyl carrier protein
MNDEERTRASFMPDRFHEAPVDGPVPMMYKTGDLGRMLPDGNIEFLGRMDYQVKIRGYRVELGEIENKLTKHPAVREAVVVDRTDTMGVKYLCAYIVWRQTVTVVEIREYLANELPDYMIPTYFIGIEQIPLTPNGKIDRKALPEPEGNLRTNTEYIAPQNEIQEILADIWQEALGVAKVGIDDDFFDLGGHSLMAMNISVLSKKKGLDLPVQAIFRYTTIAKIFENVELKISKETGAQDNDLPVENAADLYRRTQPYQFGPNPRKELPIVMQREVTSYLFRAYPLCIALAFDNLRSWYYQKMIQICAQIHDDGYVILDYMEKFDFTSEVMVNLKLRLEELKDIDNIVNYVIEKINDGYYLSICLDEYHLGGKPKFRNTHFVHETLIYGYDNLERRFSGLGFDESGIFNTFTLDYHAVTMAFEDAKIYYPDSAPYAVEQAIRLFRPLDIKTQAGVYPFDCNAFLQRLNDYLCSKGAITEINYIVPPTLKRDHLTRKNLRYGLEVGQVVVDRLERMIRGEILIDYRALHLLAEHKRGLLARLKYVAGLMGGAGATANTLAEYGSVVAGFETIRAEALKVMNSASKDDLFRYLERIIETMKSSLEKEKLILGALYRRLRGGSE